MMKNRSFEMRGQECCDPYCFGTDDASAENFFCNCYTSFITVYVVAMAISAGSTALFFRRHSLGGDGAVAEASTLLLGGILFGAVILTLAGSNCSGGSGSSGGSVRGQGREAAGDGPEDLEDFDSRVQGRFSTDLKVNIYGVFSLVLCVLSHWWVWKSRRTGGQTGTYMYIRTYVDKTAR